MKLPRVVTGDARCIGNDDSGGNRFIGCPWGHHALDNQNAFPFWMDPEAQDLLKTHRCRATAGQYDGVLFLRFNHGSNSLIAFTPAAVPHLSLRKMTIAKNSYSSLHR